MLNVRTHWSCLKEAIPMRQFQCVTTTYVTENKEENYLEI